MNYRGFICSLDNKDYRVDIIADSGSTYTELTFAGGSSLTLEYSDSQTPFDPIRTSTLSMTFINNDYLSDLLKPHADDVLVKLYSKGHGSNSWNTRPNFIGYLQQAGSQNAGYENCLEQVTLTANDVLLTAQFKKYTNKSGTSKKQVVLVSDLLERFQTMFNLFEVRWPKSKLMADEDYKQGYNEILAIPEHLHISENNFYSSDTDNAWDWMHIIESLAKYFGFTALMYQDSLYFIDYLDYARVNETTFANKFTQYVSHMAGDSYWGHGNYSNVMKRITKDSYRGTGHQISFNPIYNKVKVVDNYYEVNELIPNILDEDSVIPEYGNLKECRFVEPRMQPHRFVNSDGYIQDDKAENYYYYKREFKSKHYDSHWYKNNGTEMTPEEIKAINGFQVLDNGKVEETVMGTDVWVNGWEIDFWDGTKEGCSIDFAYNNVPDEIIVRYHGGYGTGGWVHDVQGNLVPGYSIYVRGIFYDIVNPSLDYNYQWHEYDDGTTHFFYAFNGYSVGIVPISNPVTDISKYTYYGQVFMDEFGTIDYNYIDPHMPIVIYGAAGIYYGGTAAVSSAAMRLYLDNSTNEDSKDFTATFTYAVGTAWEASTTQNITLEPHAFTTLEMFTWVNSGQYDGEKLCRVNVNGDIQEWTINEVDNPAYANGSNLIRLYRGAKIVDYANFRKEEYQNELPSDISFTRYLAISQQGGTSGTSATSLVDRYKPVFTLSDSTAPALLVDTKSTSIIIDAEAIFERYRGTDYINPEWESEPRNKGEIHPALVLTLGIGNKYWDGYKWATGKTAFEVPLQWKSTQYVDQDDNKYSKENLWNSDLHVKNQVSWADWTGANGYVIPLNGVNLNGDITFEIRMPKEAQENVSGSFADTSINGMCYISKLDMYLGTDGGELDDLSDIVYENIIDSDAVNELSPIELDITSYPGYGKMSYSHLGYYGNLFKNIRDINVHAEPQAEEINLIERYVHQFETKTTVKDLELKISQVEPFWAYIDMYDDNDRYQPYVVLGQSKDYYMGVCSTHLMELKKYFDYPECNVLKIKFSDGNYPQPDLPAHYILDDMNNDLIDIKSTPDGNGGYIVEYVFVHPIGNFARGFPSIFRGLTNLTDVWLPSTLGKTFNTAHFYPTAFSGCSNLNHIVFNSKTAPKYYSNFVFEGISPTGLMEYPQGANYTDWYKALPTDWSGIVWIDNPDIGVSSAYTVATRSFNYIGASAANLRVSSNASWCGANLTSNGNNTYTLTATIRENTSVDARACKITVTDGEKTKYVNVSQSHAQLVLESSPVVNSATTITFKPDGTPAATESNYLSLLIKTNAPDYVMTSGETWINTNWQEGSWTEADGLYSRTININCDSQNIIPRSGYTKVYATHNSESKEIKMSISQQGKAKVGWAVYIWYNGRWVSTSWADRNITHANVYSDTEYVLVRASLNYDGIPDYSSGTNLNMIIDQTNSNFAAGPTNPVKFQVVSDAPGVGKKFVPCFTKTMPVQYQEMFAQPAYSDCAYCAFPWRARQGVVGQWDLSYGLSVGDEVRLRLYSENVPIELENTTIYLRLKS